MDKKYLLNTFLNLRKNFADKRITVLFCDIQDKYTDKVQYGDSLIKAASLMGEVSTLFGLNHLITEHVPKTFGHTHKEILSTLKDPNIKEKHSFAMLNDEQIINEYKGDHTFILLGIEAQICVFQTAIKLLQHEKDVILIKDAITSTSEKEKDLALSTLKDLGVGVMSIQSFAMFLLEDSKNESFKKTLPIIKRLVEFKNELI